MIVYFDLNRKFDSHFLTKIIMGYFVFIPAILGYFFIHALLCVLFNSVTLEAMLLFFIVSLSTGYRQSIQLSVM